MPITIADFLADRQGRRYTDVTSDPAAGPPFAAALNLLSRPEIERRLVESELHHDRPALAGVVRELEHLSIVDQFFRSNDGHRTRRFRQAVGVAVRIVMEQLGWRTAGAKGSLGQRVKVAAGTTAPGAYYNTTGLALWFTRAERYTRPNLPW